MLRKKILVALLMGVVTSIATLPIPQQTVYAAEQKQMIKAFAKTFNISCNGKTITVPAYVIDGRSYFRIADIANVLDMKVASGYGKDKKGIKLSDDKPYDGDGVAPVSDIEKKDQMVTLSNNGLWVGSAGEGQVKSINVGNRNYVMVRDVAEIAKMNYDKWDSYYKEKAKLSEDEYATTLLPVLKSFTVDWDSATQTVVLGMNKVDMKTYRHNVAVENSSTVKQNTQTTQPNEKNNTTNEAKTKGALTSAPKEGVTLANILKDTSMTSLYGSDGVMTKEGLLNFTEIYRYSGTIGQCTWYTRGRFLEVNGIDIQEGEGVGGTSRMISEAEKNKKGILKVIRDADSIVSNSLAVWNGHVVYVEYVERDANRKPTYVYFSEGNSTGSDTFVPNKDGAIKKMAFSNFIVRGDYWDKNGKVMGYITVADK